MKLRQWAILVFSIPALVLCADPAAGAMRWDVTLDGPTAGTDSDATGTAVLILDDTMTELSYDIRIFNLEGVEGAAHFHNGTPDRFEEVIFNLPLGTPKQGVWALTPSDLDILLAGFLVILVHTDLHPDGEIRGVATDGVVAAEERTWSGLKALYR